MKLGKAHPYGSQGLGRQVDLLDGARAASRGSKAKAEGLPSTRAGLQTGLERSISVGKLKSKCIVKDCPNKRSQGVFVGDLCAPCHDFITTGKVDFGNCQAGRNAVSFAASGLSKLIETHARQVAVIFNQLHHQVTFRL